MMGTGTGMGEGGAAYILAQGSFHITEDIGSPRSKPPEYRAHVGVRGQIGSGLQAHWTRVGAGVARKQWVWRSAMNG